MKIFNYGNRTKIGLALGGGGARGYAYLGVLRAFEEHGIEFDYIAGTSAGAILGSFMAAGLTYKEMKKEVENFSLKDIKTTKIPFMPNKTDNLEKRVNEILNKATFEDLKTPFCAVATDVISGTEKHLTSGNVARSVVASCAVPGIFMPVQIGKYKLFDGGLLNNIPSSVPKKFGCDYVVAVDIHSTRGQGTSSDKYFDQLAASVRIMMKSSSLKGYMTADVMIAPDMHKFSSTKIISPQSMIEEGYNATIMKMPEIKQLFGYRTKYNKVGVEAPTITSKNRMII